MITSIEREWPRWIEYYCRESVLREPDEGASPTLKRPQALEEWAL